MIKVLILSFIITFGLRAVPYLFFGRADHLPDWLEYLGKYLPPAIMAALVIYASKDLFLLNDNFTAMLSGIAATVATHLLRRNTILSIVIGTAVYMLILRAF